MRENLFARLTNDKLEECYVSYKRILCEREQNKELYCDFVQKYEVMVGKKTANYIASSDMFHEIARRYFKICDLLDNLSGFLSSGGIYNAIK